MMEGTQELAQATLAIALDELVHGAGEEGGNNRGRWVRKYMGVEEQPWCVGFATWCYREACRALGAMPKVTERWSSSRLVKEAIRLGVLLQPTDVRREPPGIAGDKAAGEPGTGSPAAGSATSAMAGSGLSAPSVQPGHFFVVRGGPTGYQHTGLVRELHFDAAGRLTGVTTVEGNVRPEGGGRRDRVLSRRRSVGQLVFVAY
jgi:hypothetical protein